MGLHNKYGYGQLVCFSGIDGGNEPCRRFRGNITGRLALSLCWLTGFTIHLFMQP